MARVDVIAYTPTEFLEEKDVTIGLCRDLVEKYAVSWVNDGGLDDRTTGELGTFFGGAAVGRAAPRDAGMAHAGSVAEMRYEGDGEERGVERCRRMYSE